MEQGRVLVDAEDKKLAHEVFTRIATAKAFFDHLIDTEVHDRYNGAPTGASWHGAARRLPSLRTPGCR